MLALARLEWWYLRHQAGTIRRQPARALIWVGYLAFVGLALGHRFTGTGHAAPAVPMTTAHALAGPVATAIGGIVLAFAGATIVGAAGGRASGFRSTAEAVMFSNAGIRPLTIATWLQLRALGLRSVRLMASIVYFVALVAPVHGPTATVGLVLRCALVVVAVVGLTLPAFLWSRTVVVRRVLEIAGWFAIADGIGSLVAAFVEPASYAGVVRLGLDPGETIRALVAGAPLVYAIPALIILIEIALVRATAGDALPELYAASLRANVALTARHASADASHVRPGGRVRVPSGAAAIVWKEWAALRHQRRALQTAIAIALGALGTGYVAGAVAIRTNDLTFPALCGTLELLIALLFAPLGASQRLALELGQPLFWLGRAPLRTRIGMWAVGFGWRGALTLGLVQFGIALAWGRPLAATAALFGTAVAYGSLVAFGVGLFALFPAPIDARGPLALLRLAATGVYLIPAAVVTALVFALRGPDALAIGLGIATLGCEGWATIALATLRFEQRGASFAALGRAR